MGLRAYDILALRFQDIDWKNRQISIVMKKTKTQITLPLPVEVGNAVYSYITSGRPKTGTEYILSGLKLHTENSQVRYVQKHSTVNVKPCALDN